MIELGVVMDFGDEGGLVRLQHGGEVVGLGDEVG